MKNYDAVIIGFGKAGKTLAGKLGAMGKDVALIEKSNKMYGGTCINVGCIPSKSLVHSGMEAKLNDNKAFADKKAFYKNSMEKKRELVKKLRDKNYDKVNSGKTVTVIDGIASFVDSHTIEIKKESEVVKITGEKIYINTGATSVIPKIKGVENNPFVYYSDGMLDLEVLPEKLYIIGGGYIGLEFASMYTNFGSKVTVLQDGDKFVPREDDDIADVMKENLEKQGVEIKMGVAIEELTKDGFVKYKKDGKDYADKADAILVATGRRANTDGLNAEKAGVKLTDRGAIEVNERLETSQKNIYAMGDVTGGLQFTYLSLDDYRIIMSGIEGGEYNRNKRGFVPYSVFLDTPFARVGINEKEAQRANIKYRVVKLPTAAVPKANVLENPKGVLKALIEEETGKILGVMLLCEESYEIINVCKLAMDYGATYEVFKNMIFTHPTMGEALNDLFTI